jgi:hypothetical protein
VVKKKNVFKWYVGGVFEVVFFVVEGGRVAGKLVILEGKENGIVGEGYKIGEEFDDGGFAGADWTGEENRLIGMNNTRAVNEVNMMLKEPGGSKTLEAII